MCTFEDVREHYDIEQIIRYFKVDIEGKLCRCPFHHDPVPSMHLNQKFVWCYAGCGSYDTFSFVYKMINAKAVSDVFRWFEQHKDAIPAKSDISYTKSTYDGPVSKNLIDYWYSCLTEDHVKHLQDTRLLTEDTIRLYQLGYRPDMNAYVIPFWQGVPQQSEVEIVQFRMLDSKAKVKYTGLAGHNRKAFMNAHLLEQEQPYLIVLFGAFDPILALQDGLLAVGLNGCSIPKDEGERERIKELFKKQTNVYVLPDNTESEVSPGYKFAELIGARMRLFPSDLPNGCDYIDYRKLGKSREDFLDEVMQFEPFEVVSPFLVEGIYELAEHGDPYNFIPVYMGMLGKGSAIANVSRELGKKYKGDTREMFQQVKGLEQFNKALGVIKQRHNDSIGGW